MSGRPCSDQKVRSKPLGRVPHDAGHSGHLCSKGTVFLSTQSLFLKTYEPYRAKHKKGVLPSEYAEGRAKKDGI